MNFEVIPEPDGSTDWAAVPPIEHPGEGFGVLIDHDLAWWDRETRGAQPGRVAVQHPYRGDVVSINEDGRTLGLNE